MERGKVPQCPKAVRVLVYSGLNQRGDARIEQFNAESSNYQMNQTYRAMIANFTSIPNIDSKAAWLTSAIYLCSDCYHEA